MQFVLNPKGVLKWQIQSYNEIITSPNKARRLYFLYNSQAFHNEKNPAVFINL